MTANTSREASLSRTTDLESAAEEQFRIKLMLLLEHQQPENRVEERILAGLKTKEPTDHINQK